MTGGRMMTREDLNKLLRHSQPVVERDLSGFDFRGEPCAAPSSSKPIYAARAWPVCDLSSASFSKCDLTGADVGDAVIHACMFADCKLFAVRFAVRTLEHTGFTRCDLTSSDWAIGRSRPAPG